MATFKCKEELDEIQTYDEVMEYRRSILRRPVYDKINGSRYIEELEMYLDLRFKEVFMSRLDKYRAIVADANADDWDRRAAEIIISMGAGNEEIYQFFLKKIKFLEPMKYINL